MSPAEHPCDALEERYPDALEHIQEYAIFMLKSDGLICTWNVGVQRLFGYEKEEWVGKHTSAIFTPEDRAKGEPAREISRAGAQGKASDDRWHFRKDGTRFQGSGVITAIYDDKKQLLGFCKVVRDNSDREAAEEALATSRREAALRLETQAALATAIEAERARFGQELHDGACQELLGAALLIAVKAKEFRDLHPSVAETLHEIETHVRHAAEHIRNIASGLHPPQLAKGGLESALSALVAQTSPSVHCTLSHKGELDLAPEAQLHLYRIAQEAIANALKHGAPTEIQVEISSRGDELELSIHDDGKGFTPEKNLGMGLRNMRCRAEAIGAELLIDSKPALGTTITCRLGAPRPV